MLSAPLMLVVMSQLLIRLNTRFGARSFLTPTRFGTRPGQPCLNASFGARCFLTETNDGFAGCSLVPVLMGLMALGAI